MEESKRCPQSATESIEAESPDPSSNTKDCNSDWDPEFIKEECSLKLKIQREGKRRSRRINIPDEENLSEETDAFQ